MTRPRARLLSLCVASAMMVGLSACSGVGLPTFDPLVENGANSTNGAHTENDPSGENTPDKSSDTDPAAQSADCLVGQWTIPEEQLHEFYSDALESVAEFQVTGDAGITFAENDYEYWPRFTLTMSVAGHEATAVSSGSITGSYTADNAILTTSHDTSTVAVAVSVMGKVIDGGSEFDAMLGTSPFASAPYRCEAGKPVLMFQTADGGRMPIALRAA